MRFAHGMNRRQDIIVMAYNLKNEGGFINFVLDNTHIDVPQGSEPYTLVLNGIVNDEAVRKIIKVPAKMPANYEHFHIPGVTDEAQIKKEAEYRFAQPGHWTSVIHQHKHLQDCKGKCKIIQAHEHTENCVDRCDRIAEWVLLKGEISND